MTLRCAREAPGFFLALKQNSQFFLIFSSIFLTLSRHSSFFIAIPPRSEFFPCNLLNFWISGIFLVCFFGILIFSSNLPKSFYQFFGIF